MLLLKGLQGADALQSDEYKEFLQSNDLKNYAPQQWNMTQDAGAPERLGCNEIT